jgi:CSLREA domain-containing protein
MKRTTTTHPHATTPYRLAPLALLVALLSTIVVPAQPTYADSVILVDTAADIIANDGACSLREAIEAANSSQVVDKCNPGGSGADTIFFTFNTRTPIVLSGPLPSLTKVAKLGGQGFQGLHRIDGNGTAGPGLQLNTPNSLLQFVTVSNFNGAGVVINADNVELNNVLISNNRGPGVVVADVVGTKEGTGGLDFVGNGGPAVVLARSGIAQGKMLNRPVVTVATNDGDAVGTRLRGRVDVAIPQKYRDDSSYRAVMSFSLFAEGRCSADGFLSSGISIGGGSLAISKTVASVNFATFLPSTIGDNSFVSVLANLKLDHGDDTLDVVDGITELSRCIPVGPQNDAWTRASEIELNDSSLGLSGSQRASLVAAGQERWYRFDVSSDSSVTVRLDDPPADYDLTLFSDIEQAYNQPPQSLEELTLIDAEVASINGELPLAPNALSPETISPEAFAPAALEPLAFDDNVFDSLSVAPRRHSPTGFELQFFDPTLLDNDEFSPDTPPIDPERFVSAQARSLLGVAALDGTASEQATINTWDKPGSYYLRVTGRNGAHTPIQPFEISVQVTPSACQAVVAPTAPPAAISAANGYTTIIVSDLSRVAGSAAEKVTLQARLEALADRPEVRGVIIDLSDTGRYARVAQARAEALANPTCPYAMNLLADEIKTIVDGYRAQNPLRYVVIVGNDDVVPFFRSPDTAGLGNESGYQPPVDDASPSQANLRRGYILSQDAYGAGPTLRAGTTEVVLPELAVGRLVETAAEATTMLDAYLATANGVVETPSSAFVSGYDFLSDAATAIAGELALGLNAAPRSLIADPQKSPNDPSMWTATQLRTELLRTDATGDGADLMYLAGHFDGNSALAADHRTSLQASVVANDAVPLTNAVIFSNGCHSGYNIVAAHAIPGITDELDWAQAFARKGATLIGGTGYQYGDSEFLEYGERLYLNFSRQLRTGTGPVAVGAALVAAKQRYLAETPQPFDIHNKTVAIATLWGLPMLKIDMPGARITSPADPSRVTSTAPFSQQSGDPGDVLGLRFADYALDPTLATQTVPLKNLDGGATVAATYLRGADGVVVWPSEPVLPLESGNVRVANTALRGVGFRGGSYRDLQAILPLTGAAATELRGAHTTFPTSIFYPSQPWNVNYFDTLLDPQNGATRLNVTPAQFLQTNATNGTGTLRRYDSMNFRLFYSSNTQQYGQNVPALVAPPAIVRVTSAVRGSQVLIRAYVVGDPAAGIQSVWLAYTGLSGGLYGTWQSLDLAQNNSDATLWEGTLDLATSGTAPADLRWMVQAVNGVGLVSLDDNEGTYYEPGVDPGALPSGTRAATAITLNAPATGQFGGQVTLQATLTSNGATLANRRVLFSLGSQSNEATTNQNGVATLALPLSDLPGTYTASATFAGDATYAPTPAASTSFVLTPATATLTLSGGDHENRPLLATLSNARGLPLGGQSVAFIIRGSGGVNATTIVATNTAGQAALNAVSLPAGNYTLTASTGASATQPGGQQLNLGDPRYTAAQTTRNLTIRPISAVFECVVDRGVGTNPRYLARFGYKNHHPFVMSIPLGPNNRFTPNPIDRGQPTQFAPGRQRFVFEVPFPGSNLVWTLNGRTSTASSGSARCAR